jgi:hypothetical protein
MPRKSRRKSQPESPASDPAPVAEVLADSPIAQILASREAKAAIDPERPMPENDGSEAVAAFLRQQEREQAMAEPPKPEQPVRRQKTWGETVRGWTSHGETGVRHVSTTSPDMVGIAFPKDRPRTAEEKREMEDIGLKFFSEAQAWLKTNRNGAFDETQDMARKFAERRRERAEAGHER